jgi:tetratricopeptide (TPR) repeat protein
MVEQRQIAERQRQAGNTAFKQQQYSEALRCYQAGIEVQRHSMALHANAAAAALKLNCYVQALEHCDKVREKFQAAMPPLVACYWGVITVLYRHSLH